LIDEGLSDSWPPEVLEALVRFKQGHLIQQPPIFYAASPAYGVWDLTRTAGDAAEDLLELADEDRPRYGLITTQTCDIAEEGRPDHPWIEVVPVYPLIDISKEDLELIESHRRSHLVLLEPPELEGGPWVADLRIQVPIEKSWLVGREPFESFPTEEAYQILAERLAAKRERPALATPVMDNIVRPLANWLRRGGGIKAAATVDELRLAVGPSRLTVDRASLLVLTNDEPLSPADRVPWDKWWGRTQPRAAEIGIDLLGNQYETYDTLSARAYKATVPLDFGYLSRGV
jgi:hypothetical protein